MRVKLYGENGQYLGTATLGDKESSPLPYVIHNRGRYFLRQGQTDVYREFDQASVIDFVFDTKDFSEDEGIDTDANLDDDEPKKMGSNAKKLAPSKLVTNPKAKEGGKAETKEDDDDNEGSDGDNVTKPATGKPGDPGVSTEGAKEGGTGSGLPTTGATTMPRPGGVVDRNPRNRR